jgi:hypothetical protein
MFRVIGLAEDIVSPILNPRGSVVPVRALVIGLVIYMHPNFWRRRDQHPRRDTGDRTWRATSVLVTAGDMAFGKGGKALQSSSRLIRTIFLVDLCIPLVAVATKHGYAMGPVRDTSPRGASELAQPGIRGDCPEDIEG